MIKDPSFREKYGMFATIEENYNFIASNPRDQKGKDSIQWIAPYMGILRKYASECKHVTEFGVNQVNSTYAFLAAKPQKVVSIDIDLHKRASKNVPKFKGKNLWLEWAKEISKQEEIEFVAIEGDSATIDIEPTELLFIDSKHVGSHLKSELAKHKNLVSKYIIFHDTTLFKDQLMPTIDKFLQEEVFEVVEHITSSPGLMVIKRIQA